MGADSIKSNSDWRKRYDAAHKVLDDARVIARYQRLVDLCDPAAPPSAHIFTRPGVARRARRVCLLAGSFNPLTVAHVALAEAARRVAQIDVIIWIYTAITIDKERIARASLSDRLAQLHAYVENTASPEGNLLALLNRGLYVDQASAIRPLLATGSELYILVGFDKIVQIFDPQYYSDREAALLALFAQAKLLVAPRAGVGKVELEALLAKPENAPYTNHVQFLPVPPQYAEESSTEARALAERNGAIASNALHRLVTPEGIALVGTGAYAPIISATDSPPPDVNDARDAYLWRQMWIRAFARTRSPAVWHDVLPLSVMLKQTVARDEHGAEIRDLLIRAVTAPQKTIGKLLSAALASMR